MKKTVFSILLALLCSILFTTPALCKKKPPINPEGRQYETANQNAKFKRSELSNEIFSNSYEEKKTILAGTTEFEVIDTVGIWDDSSCGISGEFGVSDSACPFNPWSDGYYEWFDPYAEFSWLVD